MKINRKVVIAVSGLIIVLIAALLFKREEIKKCSNIEFVIRKYSENSLSKEDKIEVFRKIDRSEVVFVGYKVNGQEQIRYAILKKNSDATYTLLGDGDASKMIERSDSVFIKYYTYANETSENCNYMIVLNLNDSKRTFKLSNDKSSPQEITLESNDLGVIKYPEGGGINYSFYDGDGKLIEDF